MTGSVLLGDRDVAGLSDKQFTALRGKDIAMVFQEPGATLDPLFTVGYQISEAIRAHTGMNRSQARDRAVELMRLVRLPDPERRYGYYPHELSGGRSSAWSSPARSRATRMSSSPTNRPPRWT